MGRRNRTSGGVALLGRSGPAGDSVQHGLVSSADASCGAVFVLGAPSGVPSCLRAWRMHVRSVLLCAPRGSSVRLHAWRMHVCPLSSVGCVLDTTQSFDLCFFLSWLYQIFVAVDSFVSSAEFFVFADGFVPSADEATVASGASYFSIWLRRTSVVTHPRVVPLRCAGPSL